ncbi:MAG: glycosyltransferase [Gemmobacter sp.]|nr:glycosyltransferase [Gemmobacter sp.]
MKLSVILPASNEQDWIGPCLQALLASDPVGMPAEVLVIANACHDGTVAVAQAFQAKAQAAGWDLRVIELAEPGKLNALNVGDGLAQGDIRVYLDADVTVSPGLIAALARALGGATGPAYASGRPKVAKAGSWATRAYARFWSGMPFTQSVAPGFGLFAVNAAGRARWGDWPAIISDDTYARLQFSPEERIEVPHGYVWPMVEGFSRLVKVRRRQDAGVAEIAARWPDLIAHEGKAALGFSSVLRRAAADPVGFAVYAVVSLAVRTQAGSAAWVRGR